MESVAEKFRDNEIDKDLEIKAPKQLLQVKKLKFFQYFSKILMFFSILRWERRGKNHGTIKP